MLRTISVFEHGTLKVGAAASQGAAQLTQAEFDALVRFNDEHRQQYFGVGYRSVTFRQFVGYLQVGDLGIEILPKADRRSDDDARPWRTMLFEMLKVGLGIDLQISETATQSLTRPSLIELVVANLVPNVERIAHEGLVRGYRQEETNGTTFRGRLVVADHIRHNHSRADRCFVRYPVYDCDTQVNRLLRAALEVAARAPISGPLRARVLSVLPRFGDVKHVVPTADAFDRLVLTRTTERYRDALLLSRMLLEGLSPALRAGRVSVFALLFDMNALWERYVGVLFQRAGRGRVRVVLQNKRAFWGMADATPRTIRPDIVLMAPGSAEVVAILDTKWKLADSRGPADDDLKQMFVYNEMFDAPEAFLLYPTASTSPAAARGSFWGRQHRCSVLELGLQHGSTSRTAAVTAQIREVIDSLAITATSAGAQSAAAGNY
jgi:5-methylcytosine-specific restriction enzyme subunit McrC